jgi:cell division protein FtsQ
VERLRAIPRNSAAAADAESYRPELLAEEEPRYLRRQKPVEIRRKKFSGRSGSFYRRVFFGVLAGGLLAALCGLAVRFALYSPSVLLEKPEQIEVKGNHIVSPEAVRQQFVHDRGRSVLLISLDARRSQLQELPWVEQASVQRILPNRIRVELTERTPIAFLRNGSELALIDAHGVLLYRPEGAELHFPIVTGVSENMPREERERRMQIYEEFLKDADLVRSGSSDNVSEVDFSNSRDLRVVMTGLAGQSDPQAVTLHFGQDNFTGKYKNVIDNFSQWQAKNGRIQSLDLQYSRQVVVNPDATVSAAKTR